MPLLALLTGPLGKIAGIAALALALLAAGAVALHRHDAAVIAAVQAKQEAAARQAEEATQVRINAAVDQVARDAAARIAAANDTRKVIYAAPQTMGCADRPAIRAAIDSLRPAHGRGGGQAFGDPGKPVGVPGSAAAGQSRQ